jgi:isopentenyl-diphosphate delta-isomerase
MSVDRKADHVDICLTKPVDADYNYWDDVHPVHHSLPEFGFDEIDTSVTLFDKKLKAPLLIAAMTGGFQSDKYDAKVINGNLAAGAAAAGIGMGVGSQRVAVVNHEHEDTFSVVKDHDVPLVLGNIGAPQLIDQKEGKRPLGKEELEYARELIGADAIAVHLNYLQEVAMVDGDLNAEGCLDAIKALAKDVPLVAKETGAGISREVAMLLLDAGMIGIDVGGLSGTSFAAVEKHRADVKDDRLHARVGETFWNWGIPTPISVLEADVGLPIIATGGIRNGLDTARAIMLGASSAGIARRILPAAVKSSDAVAEELETIILELKSAMFLLGARSIDALNKRNFIFTGDTLLWYNQRLIQLRGGV